jgi:hypothetical protein
MRKHKTLITVVVLITAALAVCLVVAAVFSSLARRPKPGAFDDSDLIPTRIEVPVESNAFWTLLQATNELYWPKSLDHKLSDLSNNTNWDDSLAAEVLEKNHACLDWFDKSFQQPFLLVPEQKTFVEEYPYLGDWKAISRVESIQANALFRSHNEKAAFDSALKIIKFGQRTENSGGPIIHYLVGSAIKTVGLQRIQQMTAQTALSEADLMALIRELDRLGPNKEGLTNALKVEYQMQCKYLDDFAKGITSATNSNSEQTMNPIGLKPVFSASRTKMEFAQSARVVRDGLSKPFGEIPWSDLPVVETNRSILKSLIKGNAIGDILFELMQPALKSFVNKKSREAVNVTATQLLLALKIYKIQHDRLPESLSELVPEFSPQVPLDDFDGKPFRYLPGKKLIYSVGPDLKDSGGEGFQRNSEVYDLPFQIEF